MPNLAVDVDSWARSACYPRSTFYPLSDGPPTRGRRITRACFRTCSACGPRSQARLYSCIQKDGCRPSRADLRAPPLPFRRRPPQSNCPPNSVPRPDSWPQVRNPAIQGWYPKGDSTAPNDSASKSPTYPVHELPNLSIKLQ